jgi:hypothetical protein
LNFQAASAENVSFANNINTSGLLVLDNPTTFTGHISGFAGDGTLLNSDQLDLKGFTFDAGTTRLFTPNAGGSGTLTIPENGTPIDSIVFANGTYTTANFVLSEDSTNNGILVVDPASTSNTVSTVSAVVVATGTQTTVGVTDAPINMALSNPPAANGQPVTVTVAGLRAIGS